MSSPASHSVTTLKATQLGFGISQIESTSEAVAEAVAQASKELSGEIPSLAFVSATIGRRIEEVQEALKGSLPAGTPVHGLTSSGSILTKEGRKAGGVGCLLISSPDELSFATGYHATDGAKAVQMLKEKMTSPKTIFMSATPGAEEGVIDVLSKEFEGVPVFGGTAADDDLSGKWNVFSSDESSGTGVSLVGVGSSVRIGCSMLGPYTTTSTIVTATKTEGRRVFEIDGKCAAEWTYNWLGGSANADIQDSYENGGLILPATADKPIAIALPGADEEFITAHCAAFGGKANPCVDFFTPIPEGSKLVVMDSGDGPSTGYSKALSDAYDTAAKSLEGGKVAGGLLLFCGGMAIAVGDKIDSGLTSTEFSSKVSDMPMMGMTVFGEQACLAKSKTNCQRNLSTGMILFG